jgi:adenosylcobinamide-GDP ribazoletransferase
MRSFWLALQFLTRLPTPTLHDIQAQQVGRSLIWYPLVGLLLGAILYGAAWLLQGQPPLLVAAILLALWVGLSGALHLDGLADTADAWVGGMGDRERTLAIMKDPASGPMGVSAVLVVLLLKFAALVALPPVALLLIPALARSGTALLFVTTRYVRPGGIGEALARHSPRAAVIIGALLVTAAALFIWQWHGTILLIASALLWWLLRHALIKRLGGFTGDTAGAMLELLECLALVVMALNINL